MGYVWIFLLTLDLCGAEVYVVQRFMGQEEKKKRALSLSQYKIPNRYTDVGK